MKQSKRQQRLGGTTFCSAAAAAQALTNQPTSLVQPVRPRAFRRPYGRHACLNLGTTFHVHPRIKPAVDGYPDLSAWRPLR